MTHTKSEHCPAYSACFLPKKVYTVRREAIRSRDEAAQATLWFWHLMYRKSEN